MKIFLIFSLVCASLNVFAQQRSDWLIDNRGFVAKTEESTDGKRISIGNGLLRRTFRVKDGIACVGFENMTTAEQLLRAVKPEARITLNGTDYTIGGLIGQREQAYLLDAWIDSLKAAPSAFVFQRYTEKSILPLIHWKPRFWRLNDQQATGRELVFTYTGTAAVAGALVEIHYAVFDGIPLLSKWVCVKNRGEEGLRVDQIVHEILAAPEEESAVVGKTTQMKVPHSLYIENDFAFNNSMKASLSDQATHWKADSTYTSQVNYDYQTPCLLEIYPEKGMHITLGKGEEMTSVRSYELLLDSYDRERNGLAQRRIYSTIAPWTTENPVFMHLVSTDEKVVKTAIDQCAETGYEAVILSFGSGLNMEDTSAANIRTYKAYADYAHGKGIALGGYSLFSSRRIDDETDVIDPKTNKPGGAFFGHAPCLGSRWGLAYIAKLKKFIGETGFDLFENDGPYPGDVCASTTHPGHKGLEDSQWRQMALQKDLYHWMSEHGVYVNAPDWYFLDGTNKIALGYREVNFSLPRAQQVILNRQNIFDGTWEKTPSMSWGFVPLTEYQGGGAAATLEPLDGHLATYEQLMMQYYGAGVQACYRGPRLYDTERTKSKVKEVIGWYKTHRTVLNANFIHLRRADGRDWDGIMHVDPRGKEKALVMLYNPLKTAIRRKVNLPLYYTGLREKALVRIKNEGEKGYAPDRDYTISVDVDIPAEGYTWMLIR